MNKRQLHHFRTKVRWIKPWYFLVLAVISGVICVFALRENNRQMMVRRDAVYRADKENTDVQKPLKELQDYVTSHMNTDLSTGKNSVYPPIQLKYTYDRLVEARAQKMAGGGGDLYSQAQAHCEAQNRADFSGRNRIPCIQQYVQSHGGAQEPLPEIPDALYKFSFVTPRWSPDLAGWSMAAAVLSTLLFLVTFITGRILRRYSR